MSLRSGIKTICPIKKKEGLTDEEFKHHYLTVHAPMAYPIMQKHRVISYNLQFTLSKDKADLRVASGGQAGHLDCDVVTTVMFPDMAAFKSFMADPDVVEKLGKHEPNFIQPGKYEITFGEEDVFLQDEKYVGEL